MDTQYNYLITDNNGTYVGNHLIADLWGIINHTDTTEILSNFVSACQLAKATVLFSHCHPFGPESGTTGVIVLAESHLSWHHYPEINMISVDIFMCGSANPSIALEFIEQYWKPSHVDRQTLRRGHVERFKLKSP